MTQNAQTTTASYCQNIFDLITKSSFSGIEALNYTQGDFDGYSNPEQHKKGHAFIYQRHKGNLNVFRKISAHGAEGIVVTLIDIENNRQAIFSKDGSSIYPLAESFKENMLLACGLNIWGQPLPEPDIEEYTL